MSVRSTYINGEWLPEAAAKISIFDSHFMFGDAVFEMHRTFRHQHFLLDEHLDRLWTSMQYMQIPITKSKDEVRALCNEAIRRNPLPADEEYRFMINVSRGPLGIYREVFELEGGQAWNQPTWIINIWPLSKTTKTLAHFYEEPADARVTVQRQVPSQFIEAKVKNRSRMHYMLANLEMMPYGKKAVPLMLDDRGCICESSGANFIMVNDGALVIPERRNMLRGCSMEFVVSVLAPALGIPVFERNFEPWDVLRADEAMFTGTFNNLLPCNRINGVRFGVDDAKLDQNSMGPVTARVVKAWNDYVIARTIRRSDADRWELDFDFVKQIREWAR